MESLADALNLYRRGLMPDAANHRRLGGALLSQGRAAEAIEILRRAIELEPGSVRAHNNLGQALLQTGSIHEASVQFGAALKLDPHYAIGYNNLGLALTAAGDFQGALAAFERSIALDASSIVARFNLAIGLERVGRLEQALAVYEQIPRSAPQFADALGARGAVLARLGRDDAALDCFSAALALRPGDATMLAHKASTLLRADRSAEALSSADGALSLRVDFTEALNLRAAALCKLNRPADALGAIDRALQLDPAYVEGWCTKAVIQQNLGEFASAVQSYRRALSLHPGCIAARTVLISALIPWVPESEISETQARSDFDAELSSFESWLGERELGETDRWGVAKQQFFHLSYQEQPNKTLLHRYRQESARRLAGIVHGTRGAESGGSADQASAARGSAARASAGTAPRRFRLGVVSAHVFDHSVFSALVQGWLGQLGRNEFEISLFSLGTRRDASTEAAALLVDHIESGGRSAADWARLIERRGLDAVIFPEIGMDQTTLAIANLRLAPRQFAAWGHPDTTGLSTIDYFLSAEAFEPPEAQDHYVEKLIRLPNLGVYYQPHAADAGEVDFAALGIASGVPVFVCPGTPFKYRPQHDSVLVDIAHRTGPCKFVFFQHDKLELSRCLDRRISAAFERAGLRAADHLVWLPWLPRQRFLGLMRKADVYLDTIGFSGFNTLMQAVQSGLPGVAYEGRFMRGRLGSGILRQLGLPELVASNLAQYADIAVRLAVDGGARAQARDKLRLAEHRLYEDAGAVAALARVLLEPPSV
jgi:predicted O-linked N-acetylglucosamine transferase (SPINDLY family)